MFFKKCRLFWTNFYTVEKTYVKEVNQILKTARAKGISTPWMVLKLVPSHASEALHLRKNNCLRSSFISTKFEYDLLIRKYN
jgi:hypothetical protein